MKTFHTLKISLKGINRCIFGVQKETFKTVLLTFERTYEETISKRVILTNAEIDKLIDELTTIKNA